MINGVDLCNPLYKSEDDNERNVTYDYFNLKKTICIINFISHNVSLKINWQILDNICIQYNLVGR